MKQHEVEALRRLMASWGKRNNPNFDICVKELEALLITIPVPDDGLREGLEEIIFNWAKDADIGTIEARLIENHIDEIEKLLATNPDGWKPIAGAPRDGSWFLALREIGDWHSKEYGDRIEKVLYINGCFEDSYERQFMEIEFTHWRPLPAPPREGKE